VAIQLVKRRALGPVELQLSAMGIFVELVCPVVQRWMAILFECPGSIPIFRILVSAVGLKLKQRRALAAIFVQQRSVGSLLIFCGSVGTVFIFGRSMGIQQQFIIPSWVSQFIQQRSVAIFFLQRGAVATVLLEQRARLGPIELEQCTSLGPIVFFVSTVGLKLEQRWSVETVFFKQCFCLGIVLIFLGTCLPTQLLQRASLGAIILKQCWRSVGSI
jgi:hypothetical protein